jgi:ubiquinone/menaquinone biosynthesis C-methylase UbiE
MAMSPDPTGMHDWHSDPYVHDWVTAQKDDERAIALRRLVHLIPFDPDAEISVLDVGGGYGALTTVVLDVFPRARVTLHDYSDPMIAEARERLAMYSDSVRYARSDLMTSDWTAPLAGGFDAVVSSIAIHNVRYPQRIREIYGEIFRLVAPGGCFLNIDLVASGGSLVTAAERHATLMDRRYRRHEDTGAWTTLAEVEAEAPPRGGRLGAAVAAEEPATLANQLRWLMEAGFDEADCFWRDARRAIIGAYRRS